MEISEKGLVRARERAHARTREWFPDDEVRGAVIAAAEAACLARSEGDSPYARAAHAVRGLVDEHVIDVEPHLVRAIASRIDNAYTTIAGGETLEELRRGATVAGGAR